mgnify:CR=1 FL=1
MNNKEPIILTIPPGMIEELREPIQEILDALIAKHDEMLAIAKRAMGEPTLEAVPNDPQ